MRIEAIKRLWFFLREENLKRVHAEIDPVVIYLIIARLGFNFEEERKESEPDFLGVYGLSTRR